MMRMRVREWKNLQCACYKRVCDAGEEIWLSGLRPSTVYLINVAAVNVVGAGRPLQFAVTTDNLRKSHFTRLLLVSE